MSTSPTKATVLRAAAVAIAATLLFVNISITSASSGGPHEVLVGSRITLNPNQLTFAETGCAPPDCHAQKNQGNAKASATFVDENGDVTLNSLLGWEYKLIQACADQNVRTSAFTLRFDYGYSLTATRSPLSTSIATASVTADADKGTTAPKATFNTTVATGTGVATTLSGTGSQVPLANVKITADKTYTTTLGAQARVKLQNTVLIGESATATANMSPAGLTFDFLDIAPPQITGVGTVPAAKNGPGTGSFLGFLNSTSAQLYVDAHDTNVSGLAMSCVANVIFEANGVPQSVSFDFNQSRAMTNGISGEGNHLTNVTVRDRANNPTAAQFSFILDTLPPATSVEISPTNNTGKNGWYKAPGPVWQIHCEAGPGDTAPCFHTELSEDGGASFVDLGSEANYTPAVTESATASAIVRSQDKAGNWNTPVSTPTTYKVDITPPSLFINETNRSIYNNGWHRIPTNVTIECSDRTSGCADINVSVNGAPPTTSIFYPCTTDSIQDLAVSVEDLAGNPTTRSHPFRCDLTNPANLRDLTVTSTFVNQSGPSSANYSTTVPTWSWTTGEDVVTNGVASGIRFYEVKFDGLAGIETTTTPSYSDPDLPDGNLCLSARSVDQAGNRGNWTSPTCVTLDRVKPSVAFNMPAPSTFYVMGNEMGNVRLINGLPTVGSTVGDKITTVVVGDIQVSITPRDNDGMNGGSPSNLERAQLILDKPQYEATKTTGAYESPTSRTDPNPPKFGDCDAGTDCQVDGDFGSTPCDISTTTTRSLTCTWNDISGTDSSAQAVRFLYSKVLDRAQNKNVTTRSYVKVKLAEIEEVPGLGCSAVNGTCNTFYWDNTIDVENFGAWVLYRSSGPAFGALTTDVAAQSADPGAFRLQDLNLPGLSPVRQGESLYYRLVALDTSNQPAFTFETLKVKHTGIERAMSVEYDFA